MFTTRQLTDRADSSLHHLRAAVEANDSQESKALVADLVRSVLDLADRIDPMPRPKPATALESNEACVRPSHEPLNEATLFLLGVIANGLAHHRAIWSFQAWLATADVSRLTLAEVRQRFEEAHPDRYLPKSVVARLLADAGINYRR